MSAATATPDSTATQPDRDRRGRFVKGNKAGPGNPFARQVGWLRQELLDCVTREDIRKVAFALIHKSAGGDVPSARLLFSYIFGKPTNGVDPDKLDLEEWRQLLDESKIHQDIPQVYPAPDPKFTLGMANEMREVMTGILRTETLKMLAGDDESGPSTKRKKRNKRKRKARAKRGHSTTEYGDTNDTPAPLPNGDFSDSACQDLPNGPAHGVAAFVDDMIANMRLAETGQPPAPEDSPPE